MDAAHGLDSAGYQDTWANTEQRVGDLMAQPEDNAALYRNVAFVLPHEATARLVVGEATEV